MDARRRIVICLTCLVCVVAGCASESPEAPKAETPEQKPPAQAQGHSHDPQLHVSLYDDRMEPKELHVTAGDRLTVVVDNKSSQEHLLVFDLPGGQRKLAEPVTAGTLAMLAFPAPDEVKEYEFYCATKGHKEKGERGKLVVGEAHHH